MPGEAPLGSRQLSSSCGPSDEAAYLDCTSAAEPPGGVDSKAGAGPVSPRGPRPGLADLKASYAVLLLLPVHHSKAAVKLGRELHAFVNIDCTFHRVSGGDQCRRSLQARGL